MILIKEKTSYCHFTDTKEIRQPEIGTFHFTELLQSTTFLCLYFTTTIIIFLLLALILHSFHGLTVLLWQLPRSLGQVRTLIFLSLSLFSHCVCTQTHTRTCTHAHTQSCLTTDWDFFHEFSKVSWALTMLQALILGRRDTRSFHLPLLEGDIKEIQQIKKSLYYSCNKCWSRLECEIKAPNMRN